MPAHVINLEEYEKLSPATVEQFGGRLLARGGALGVLEEEWRPKRLMILEFPDRARAACAPTAGEAHA